jgi:hypothetical protein
MDTCEIDGQAHSEITKGIWGNKSELIAVEDLNDGFGKKTYRLSFKNLALRCILHVWTLPSHGLTELESKADWILAPSGLDIFKRNNGFLLDRGICVPGIVMEDGSRSVCDYDFALVEYIGSNNYTEYVKNRSAAAAKALLRKIDVQLRKLHACHRSRPGLPLDGRTPAEPCEQMVLQHILLGLDFAAEYNDRIKSSKGRIQDAVNRIVGAIEPRSTLHLIHGELGPEHILIGEAEAVHFIDCEGLKFFDLEFEHSLLKARFGRDYVQFARPDLDSRMMKYYGLMHYIGWNAFASKAVTKSSIDKTWARGIMESSTREILRVVNA